MSRRIQCATHLSRCSCWYICICICISPLSLYFHFLRLCRYYLLCIHILSSLSSYVAAIPQQKSSSLLSFKKIYLSSTLIFFFIISNALRCMIHQTHLWDFKLPTVNKASWYNEFPLGLAPLQTLLKQTKNRVQQIKNVTTSFLHRKLQPLSFIICCNCHTTLTGENVAKATLVLMYLHLQHIYDYTRSSIIERRGIQPHLIIYYSVMSGTNRASRLHIAHPIQSTN